MTHSYKTPGPAPPVPDVATRTAPARAALAVEYADADSGITEACAAFDAISTAMLAQVITDRRDALHAARRGA